MSYYTDLAAKAHPTIAEAEFSVRVLRAVVEMWPGISIFGLMEKSDPELLRVPGIGRKGLREVREAAPYRHPNAATRQALDDATVTRHKTVESLMGDLNAPTATGMVEKVRIDPKLAGRVEEFLMERNLTLDQAVGLYLRAMINTSAKSRSLRLDSAMPFGKYAGERVETILLFEPGYISWLIANNTSARWDPEVLRLLEELTK